MERKLEQRRQDMGAKSVRVRYTVFARRGGMVGYFGLFDHLKGARVVGVNLREDSARRIASEWNAKERRV